MYSIQINRVSEEEVKVIAFFFNGKPLSITFSAAMSLNDFQRK